MKKVITSSAAILSKTPFKLYLKIEGDLPQSTNSIYGKGWRNRHNNSTKWKLIVGNAIERHLPDSLLERAHLSITFHTWRFRDYDGLTNSCKPLVDGLKDLVIVDDSWARTGAWKVDQKFRPKKEGPLIEVWVTEMEDLEGH